jgi:N-formylglutamate amidohydrolase
MLDGDQKSRGPGEAKSLNESDVAKPPRLDPEAPCLRIDRPTRQTLPVVVASPHSGRDYPDDLIARSALSPLRLRSSEDSFVDEIFAGAPECGAPLLQALFPRVYVDVNREPFELDQTMFADPLPAYVTTRNARIAAGLGTIARVVSNAEPIYSDKLTFAEAKERIQTYYDPYHHALAALILETREQFGYCILLDCHSMPSGAVSQRGGKTGRVRPVDTVLGDCHATACGSLVTNEAERLLVDMGYAVQRNNPYAGGFVTRHYGRPSEGIHALQIELSRSIYMDEKRVERLPTITKLSHDMANLVRSVGRIGNPSAKLSQAAE